MVELGIGMRSQIFDEYGSKSTGDITLKRYREPVEVYRLDAHAG